MDLTQQAVKEGKKWIAPMARIGYVSKGAVYVLVGVLAFMAAFGLGGSVSGPKEALRSLQPNPFGEVLLVIVAIGLCCYSIWRLVQAIYDADRRGRDAKAIGVRAGFAVSGLVHLALAWAVVQMVTGKATFDTSEKGWTAKLMDQPFGVWLVGTVGVAIGGVALYQLYRGISGGFQKRLNLSQAPEKVRTVLCRTCQIGLIARGITFGIIACFFIRAAAHYNPNEAGGLSQALGTIAAQAYGPWLLGIIGIGLVAYGVFSFVEARFRRINI